MALKEYDEASRRNPKEAKYYCNKATSLMKLMEFHTAIVELDKCLECDPKYVKAFVKKGKFLRRNFRTLSHNHEGFQEGQRRL